MQESWTEWEQREAPEGALVWMQFLNAQKAIAIIEAKRLPGQIELTVIASTALFGAPIPCKTWITIENVKILLNGGGTFKRIG